MSPTPPSREAPAVRPGLPLGRRIALGLVSGTLVLTLAALAVAFLTVRSTLRSDLRDALRRDAAAVAAAYDGRADGEIRPGPTGRVVVQVYGLDGALIAASDPAFEASEARLPDDVVAAAPADWRGRRSGRALQAAAAPFRAGTVVVLADAGYVGTAVTAVARSLVWVGVVLALAALPVAWLVSRSATAPLRRLARAADRVDDTRLEPLGLPMPDDDVGRLADVLDRLLARLRDARDAQRRFLAETSHELRTPLTSLRGFLARARRSAGPEAERDLADADRIAGTMTHLVEDLLELSRGRLSRELDLHLVAIGADVVVPAAAEVAAEVSEPGGETRDVLVLGEPLRLRQALRNLLVNARRAAGEHGRVACGWEADETTVSVWVEDDGPGLGNEDPQAVFEAFRSGPGGGTGLGLAIAKQLVEAHEGRIDVRSRPGATCFTIRLPRLEAQDDEPGGSS